MTGLEGWPFPRFPAGKTGYTHALTSGEGEVATAELYGAAVGACFLDSLATPWLWPQSEP